MGRQAGSGRAGRAWKKSHVPPPRAPLAAAAPRSSDFCHGVALFGWQVSDSATAALLPVDIDVAAMRARGDSPRAVYDEVMRRFATGQYHAPSRAGLSYMLGPVMRTFIGDSSRTPTTMVGPHFMFFAPNVTDADIGGRQNTAGPFMLTTGPHGLIFVSAGAARTQEILAESHALLEQLCAYRGELCVPKKNSPH